MSGFSLAPAARPFAFHSSDHECLVPMLISSLGVLTVLRHSHPCSWVISPLWMMMLFRRILTIMSCRAQISPATCSC